jgi:hypothetical protein
MFYNPGRAAKKTKHFTITKIIWLMLFKEIIPVYAENDKRNIYTRLKNYWLLKREVFKVWLTAETTLFS